MDNNSDAISQQEDPNSSSNSHSGGPTQAIIDPANHEASSNDSNGDEDGDVCRNLNSQAPILDGPEMSPEKEMKKEPHPDAHANSQNPRKEAGIKHMTIPDWVRSLIQIMKIPSITTYDELFKWSDFVKIGEGLNSDNYYIPSADITVKIIPFFQQKSKEPEVNYWESSSELAVSYFLSKMIRPLVPQGQPSNWIYLNKIRRVWGKQARAKKEWSNGDKGLVAAFENYSKTHGGTRMKHPNTYHSTQQSLCCMIDNPGTSLEHLVESISLVQAMSVILQLGFSISMAEKVGQFTIGYLPLESIWLKSTDRPSMIYHLNGVKVEIETYDFIAMMTDLSASRLRRAGTEREQFRIIFKDLNQFPELYDKSQGQYNIFQKVIELNGGDWGKYLPKANVLWYSHLMKSIYEKVLPTTNDHQSKEYYSKLLGHIDIHVENCQQCGGVSCFLESQLEFLKNFDAFSIMEP